MSIPRTSRFTAIASIIVTSSLGLGSTMCSSDDDSSEQNTATEQATGHFRGVLSGPGDVSGVLDLNLAPSGSTRTSSLRPLASGGSTFAITGTITLNLPPFGPTNVTGTLDLATNTATFSGTILGGTVPFTGTYANGVIRGEATLPTGRAQFVASNERLGIKLFCGSFDGSLEGRWNLVTMGAQAAAVYAARSGESGAGLGTIANNLVTVPLTSSTGATGSATGNITAAGIDGRWEYGDAINGSWAVSEGACSALTPAGGADGGVTDGGNNPDDGGTEPGNVETAYTDPGTVPLSHLALSGSKIFYALDHTYFSGLVTIKSVNTDGTSPSDVIPTNASASPKKVIGGLTATSTKVFYVGGTDSPDNDANLLSVATTGGTVTDHGSFGAASNRDFVNGVARLVNDGTNVFISFDGSGTDGIRSFDLAGASVADMGAGLVGPTTLAIDGNDLYFGDFSGVEKVTKALGTTASVFASKEEIGSLSIVVDIAFDASNVYVITNTTSGSAVWRKPKAGGSIAAVVSDSPGRFRGLAVLDGNLYFTKTATGSGQNGGGASKLLRVSAAATSGTPAEVGAANPYDVLTDGTYVYWGNGQKLDRLHK
jgi:hypothetical protein